MKKILFVLLLLAFGGGYAQNVNDVDYSKYTFEDAADYKTAEPDIIKLANIMLNSDITKAEADRLKASAFLIRWMEGTPDYTFGFDGTFNLLGNDLQLQGVYMFAMAKYAIENSAKAADMNALTLGAWQLMIVPLENPNTKIKITSKLKKVLEANKKGELETFLKKQK